MKGEIIAKSKAWTRPSKLGGRWIVLYFLTIVIAAAGMTLSGTDACAGEECAGTIGDYVWYDLNRDGIQDTEEPGISGVSVYLTGTDVDNIWVEMTEITDANGNYLFMGLCEGTYEVGVDLTTVPGGFNPTKPCSNDPAIVNENDSNSDNMTTCTPSQTVNLPDDYNNSNNLTIDFGFVGCTGSIGDYVWHDLNRDGSQDDGVTGIDGVTVNLKNDQETVIATITTGPNGFYEFTGLCAGDYTVEVDENTLPPGFEPTTPCSNDQNITYDSNANDALDDCTPVQDVNLTEDDSNNPTIDFGFVLPTDCDLIIDKKCLVAPPAPGPFDCDGKVDALKMVWNGTDTLLQSVTAYRGDVGAETLPAIISEEVINKQIRQVVTVSGYQPSTNDVIWDWVSVTDSGQSKFHLSCSDNEMNGPEDCGKAQGNGKSNEDDKYDNVWLLDGLETDKGFVLDCTPLPAEPSNNCVFEAMPPPNCETFGKPTSLTFRYTGADCTASSNNQGDKSDCTGEPGPSPVSITILKDPSKITVSPVIGDLVTISAIGKDMGSEVQLEVGGQFLKFHTSCSQPLAVGDVFGSLELVQFNGQGSGAEVTYFYEVKNNGVIDVDVTSVYDDKLGELLEMSSVQTLSSGQIYKLEKTAFISETTTNVVTAKANLSGESIQCGEAKDKVTVTVVEPTCDGSIAFDKLEDDKFKLKITNTGKIVATLETLTVNFPPEYGLIKEVKLDGAIFKKGDSNDYSHGVPSGDTIGQNNWTEQNVTKRQLDQGETRTLEVVFTQKSKGEGWVLIDSAGNATFKEGCEAELPAPSGCDIGKPTALVFQYTGEDCMPSDNDQDSGKWSCSGDPEEAQPVQIVMTKDADKFVVTPSSGIYIGETFEIRMKEDGKEFPSEIKFDIGNGQTLQSLKMHTSCSQPLSVGDQFGSVIVREFIPKP